MIGLIANENMKIYSRVRTWVLLLILLAVIIVPLFFVNMGSDHDWKETLKRDNASYEQILKEDKLSAGERQALEQSIQTNNYRIEHNLSPFGSMWSVVLEWSFVISIVTLLAIIVASDIVTSEYGWGTIKLLLIRPVGRTKVLLSKYIATLLFAFVLLAVTFAGSALIGGIAHGFGSAGDVHLSVQNGVVTESSMFVYVVNKYLLKSVNLLMLVTFAFMLSAVFRSSSLAIALSILLLFTGNTIVMLLSKYEWVKYVLFANTDLSQYLDGEHFIPGMSMSFSVIVLAVYYIIFNVVSWGVFTKRDISI